ncbi:MAG: hypothetical protein Q4C87_12885 [Actinomycetaceae bacterium]|nr:hypothetical protein [Actinomycetaceae bacterium]MDO4260406.1 hypothetical protein [Actinomycetaceae bacterium]
MSMANDPVAQGLAATAANPATEAATLREIAYHYPQLRPLVAANPSAYAGLVDWLAELGDPAVNAAIATRPDRQVSQAHYAGGQYPAQGQYGQQEYAGNGGGAGYNGAGVAAGAHNGAQDATQVYPGPAQGGYGNDYSAGASGQAAYGNGAHGGGYGAEAGNNGYHGQQAHNGGYALASSYSAQGGAAGGAAAGGTAAASGQYNSDATEYLGLPTAPSPHSQGQRTVIPPGSAAQHPDGKGPSTGRSREDKGMSSGVKFMLIALVLLALAGVVLVSLVFSGFFDRNNPAPAPADPGAQSAPQNTAPNDGAQSADVPLAFPAPESAEEMTGFASPSGNIRCGIVDGNLACAITSHDWTANGDKACEGSSSSVLVLNKDRADVDCDTGNPGGGSGTLAYGSYAKLGDYACSSSQDGISCWNMRTGTSMALARGGWMSGTGGELGVNDFDW